MTLNCTDTVLPEGIQTIPQKESPNSFDDFCLHVNSVESENKVLLYESLPSNTKYWVIIVADEYPIAVCQLEDYANYAAQQNQ